MADRDCRSGGDGRRQGGGEDEARRVGAHGVNHCGLSGDVAAQRAERLGERAFDDIDAVGEAVALGDAAATVAIHANRMDLVDVGHGVVLVGEVGDRLDGGDVAVHRIDALEHDQLGALAAGRL